MEHYRANEVVGSGGFGQAVLCTRIADNKVSDGFVVDLVLIALPCVLLYALVFSLRTVGVNQLLDLHVAYM